MDLPQSHFSFSITYQHGFECGLGWHKCLLHLSTFHHIHGYYFHKQYLLMATNLCLQCTNYTNFAYITGDIKCLKHISFCFIQVLSKVWVAQVLVVNYTHLLIGASLSEPHTSEFNGGIFIYYIYIYISVVRRFQSSTQQLSLYTQPCS